jgi:mannitol-1-phosphate 5-dehydrogenase
MLLEAQSAHAFDTYTIAEIDQGLVDAVRRNADAVMINIAHTDRIEQRRLSGIRILNPTVDADRHALLSAITAADELATAIPGVKLYGAGGPSSIAALLARGIDPAKPRILYASENNNYAAEILDEEIRRHTTDTRRLSRFQILNTVVGKMSGVIADSAVMKRLALAPMTPDSPKAIVVEEFNRILVSRVTLPGYRRGITVFEEKDDLLPFEEAKLFGHNAIHALLGYLAYGRGYRVMSEVGGDEELMAIGHEAFIEESGTTLIRKHGSSGDPLFTPAGYAAYADDLLARMTNRFLNDEIARVCRDPGRKLSYTDRIFGTMREALDQGVSPTLMARGAAAGLRYCIAEKVELGIPLPPSPDDLTATSARSILEALWKDDPTDKHREHIVELVAKAVTSAR